LNEGQFAVCNFITEKIREAYDLKISFEDPTKLATVERITILMAIDRLWQEHLYEMDSLRYSIGLRGYGQKDPLIEYKVEAFKMFDELMVSVKTQICRNVFSSASSLTALQNFMRAAPRETKHDSSSAFGQPPPTDGKTNASDIVSKAADDVSKKKLQPVRTGPKVGRNDPCPCGSGKKYKNCCGK
jgi:preprotein translocase subunit SecA